MASQQREQRRLIFEETQRLYNSDQSLIDSIAYSKQHQKVITVADNFYGMKHGCFEPAKVIVSNKRCLTAAKGYPSAKVCVHNFASASNPGGGVAKGSSAQEESICRCSTLYSCISDEAVVSRFHNAHREALRAGNMTALYNNDCIYTPRVTVFRDDITEEVLSEDSRYEIDVISCAAPNLRNMPSNAMNPDSGDKKVPISQRDLLELHKSRMCRLLAIAALNDVDVLILGAFGCGAFQNPPDIVAEAMARAVKEFRDCFKVIEFAVYCPPQNMTNYDVFSRRLRPLCD